MALRPRTGMSAAADKAQQERRDRTIGEEGARLREERAEHVQRELEAFRGYLQEFARKHKEQIRQDAKFRQQFAAMCAKLGVDPLASSKGYWAELLGMGSFYFDLGVKVISVAIATRATNGGMLGMDELLGRLDRQRKRAEEAAARVVVPSTKKKASSPAPGAATVEDICRAVDTVKCLGSGLQIRAMGGSGGGAKRGQSSSPQLLVLISVPYEMNPDQTRLLELASQSEGHVSADACTKQLQWTKDRAARVLSDLSAEGMSWWDAADGQYWFPALVPGGVNFDVL